MGALRSELVKATFECDALEIKWLLTQSAADAEDGLALAKSMWLWNNHVKNMRKNTTGAAILSKKATAELQEIIYIYDSFIK